MVTSILLILDVSGDRLATGPLPVTNVRGRKTTTHRGRAGVRVTQRRPARTRSRSLVLVRARRHATSRRLRGLVQQGGEVGATQERFEGRLTVRVLELLPGAREGCAGD